VTVTTFRAGFGDGRFDAFMGIGDYQLAAAQTAPGGSSAKNPLHHPLERSNASTAR
jgi:hypothetical protein